MKPVIICGGVGTKMWPLSCPKMPKHFLPLLGEKSLFEINYELVRKKFKPEEIFVSTNIEQRELVRKYAPDIPEENLILEPALRDTGPATGLVAAVMCRRGFGDETFVMVQTDVLRQPEDKFLEFMDLVDESVQKYGKWVTGAIRPPFAMMGVDYMLDDGQPIKTTLADVVRLNQWLMGVDKNEVEGWVAGGKAWIHANHNSWTGKKLLESYMKYKPEWGEPLRQIADGGSIEEIFPSIQKGRIEEWTKISVTKGEGLAVVVPFNWWDFGTWESVDKFVSPKSPKSKKVIEIEAENNFVKTTENKPVAIIGLSDIVVVDGPDGLLVCKKSESGKVGEVVKRLNAN